MTSDLLGSALPIVAAPMAGGPSTPALAAAVAGAGGFPFLAGGYQTRESLAAQIDQVRGLGAGFGVNVFVPSREPVDEAGFAGYAAEIQPDADVYGLRLSPDPVADDDHWEDKLGLLLADPVPVVSFTFGIPSAGALAALRRAGTRVLITVTTPAEARLARDAGADGLVVQGPDAGGHSAIFDPARTPAPAGTADLVRRVLGTVRLPVIAAGGVDGPDAVREALAAGAQAVAVGTLLLRTEEAGTSPTHRRALADPAFDRTALTRAFTGRPARALRNGFVERHDAASITAYPAVHHLTRPLRQAAGRAGDADRLHLWAGTGYRKAPTGPAAAVIRMLADGPST